MARHARTEPQFLWETAVHAVDSLRYICGDVADFACHRLSADHAEAASYAIDLSFADQAVGRVDVLPTAGMVEETYDLFGKDFRVTVTCPFGPQRGWRAFRNGAVMAEEFATDEMPADVVFGFYAEASALIDALTTGAKLKPTISEVAPSVELCMSLAAQRS
jgi:predicted dehydrogenase